MIGYIIREVMGWGLIVLGLFFFWQSYQMLNPPRVADTTAAAPDQQPRFAYPPAIFEAPAIAFIGFIVFRGGIHLLKVAVAARTSLDARRELIDAARRSRLPQAKVAIKRP